MVVAAAKAIKRKNKHKWVTPIAQLYILDGLGILASGDLEHVEYVQD